MDETNYILLEDGGRIELEDGSGFLLLEQAAPPPPSGGSDINIIMPTILGDIFAGIM